MQNNRKLLVQLISEHTGESCADVIKFAGKINVEKILTTAFSDCEVDKEDLKEFKAWATLQSVVSLELS